MKRCRINETVPTYKCTIFINSVIEIPISIFFHQSQLTEEVLATIGQHVKSEVTPRSLRMRSSGIALDHVIIKAGLALGKGYYGSVTTSDKALMPFPTLKMGPGDSARSHTADEFIFTNEIKEGVTTYIQLLSIIFNHE